MHQDPGERSSDPTRDWPSLVYECSGVSSGGTSWWWPAAGLEALSVAVHTWDLLKVTIIFITSTIVWPQANSRNGTQLQPSAENWIKDLLSMAPPITTRIVSTSVCLSHQEASISLLSFSIRKTENHSYRKLTSLITWTTAFSNSMKLWAMPCRATQDRRVMVESSEKMWPTGEGNGKPLCILALRTPWTVWKGKKIGHWKMNSPGQ